ncbi:MAG: HAD family hydrolase [Candidatus Omnitrophota bacterium]|nr:MAG: HAD family hydrolase [Candidatus Omnitrophota bacterium]
MRKTKLIIFDLDGTLVDAYAAITVSFNHTMRVLGYPLQPAKVIRRAVGWGDKRLLEPFINVQDLSRALRVYRQSHKIALLKKSRLFSGVPSLLKFLRRKGYALAIASNRPTHFSLILLTHLKIRDYFDYVLCADRLRHGKPHPDILKKIIRKLKVTPEEALYVGDMTIDIQTGANAGIKTVAVTTGSHGSFELTQSRPFLLLGRAAALKKLL